MCHNCVWCILFFIYALTCSVLNKLTLLTYQYETKQEEG